MTWNLNTNQITSNQTLRDGNAASPLSTNPKIGFKVWEELDTLNYPTINPNTGLLVNSQTFLHIGNPSNLNLYDNIQFATNGSGEFTISTPDSPNFDCGYFKVIGFELRNYAFGTNGYMYSPGVGAQQNWSPISAEKHQDITLASPPTVVSYASNPNSGFAYPKVYFTIDEYDYLTGEWDMCKSVLQIMHNNNNIEPDSNNKLRFNADNGPVAKTWSDTSFTVNGLTPQFIRMYPSGAGTDGPTFSEANTLNPVTLGDIPIVDNASHPALTGSIAIPIGDPDTSPLIANQPRKFRFNVVYLTSRFLNHSSVRAEISNNPNLYPTFADGFTTNFNLEEVGNLLRTAASNSVLGGNQFNSLTYTDSLEVEYSQAALPQLTQAGCDSEDPTGEGGEEDIEGCTDVNAANYNPDATQNDCSCEYCGNAGPAYNTYSMLQELLVLNDDDACAPSLGFSNATQAVTLLGTQFLMEGMSTPGQVDMTPDNFGQAYTSNQWINFSNPNNSYCAGLAEQYLTVWGYPVGDSPANGSWVPAIPDLYQSGGAPINQLGLDAAWELQPSHVYTVYYFSVYDINLCRGCNSDNPLEICSYQYQFTTPECQDPDEEIEDPTFYVCMCEDCDDHFTITQVDCTGTDISSYIAEHGADWENFVNFELFGQGAAALPYGLRCTCEENPPPPSIECNMQGDWVQVVDGPIDYSNSELIDIEVLFDFSPYSNYNDFVSSNGTLAFQFYSGANNISHDGIWFMESYGVNSADPASPGGDDDIYINGVPSVSVTGQNINTINNQFSTVINKLPCGPAQLKVFTVIPDPDGSDADFIPVCEAVVDYEFDCPEETIACPDPNNNFYVESTDETCIGFADGTAFIGQFGSAAVGPFNFVLQADNAEGEILQTENDADVFDLDNLAVGDYFVTVVDANGCQHVVDFTINSPTPIVFSVVTTDVTVNGGSDGTADANNITGGAGNYIVEWTDSEGNVVNNNSLEAGIYTVTITDGNGCSVTATATISEPACSIILNASVEEASSATDCDGSISLSVGGGLAPYDISWVGPGGFEADTLEISNLCVGTYYVMVCSSDSYQSQEPCCGYAAYTVSFGMCLTQEQEELIIDKVNEILYKCDCILPPVSNDLVQNNTTSGGTTLNTNYTDSIR
jgi:hypothetical protein